MAKRYSTNEIMEATDILEEMRDNCIKKDTDMYDDPKRDAKHKALTVAIDVLYHSIWVKE